MRSLVAAVAVALLGLTTGCSMLPGGKEPATPAAEADPWAGFNNGYEKNEKPAEKAAAAKPEKPAEEKTSKTETTSAELKTADAKSDDKSDASDDEDAKPVKKKPAKKKAAKKKPAGTSTVAAKKPRKRPKKS